MKKSVALWLSSINPGVAKTANIYLDICVVATCQSLCAGSGIIKYLCAFNP